MNCDCSKPAKKILFGEYFTYLKCEDDYCNFEIPFCHCNKPSYEYVSFDQTNYYKRKDRNCQFLLAICKCNKFCSIRISKTLKNPGVVFWGCRKYPNAAC